MAAITPSTVKGSLSLSIGGSAPVEVAVFDLEVEWKLDKSAFGWSASPDTSGLDPIVRRVADAIEQALHPATDEPEQPADAEPVDVPVDADPEDGTIDPEAVR